MSTFIIFLKIIVLQSSNILKYHVCYCIMEATLKVRGDITFLLRKYDIGGGKKCFILCVCNDCIASMFDNKYVYVEPSKHSSSVQNI